MATTTNPVTTLIDDFNRSDEDPVDGGAWANVPGWVTIPGDTMKLVTNRMTSGSADGIWVDSKTFYTVGAAGAAVQVRMKLATRDTNNAWGLIVKLLDESF